VLAHHVAATVLAATNNKNGNGYGTLILLVIVVLVFFAFTRSQRAKQRRQLQQRQAIEVGVEVVTTAGLIAHVVDMDEETVTLEIAPGVHSKFLRQAVVRVVQEPGPDGAAADGSGPAAEAIEPATPDDDATTTPPDRTG
jgi:preprotein translocase subunit YajC